jgi:hypothetical protein
VNPFSGAPLRVVLLVVLFDILLLLLPLATPLAFTAITSITVS